MSVALRVAGIAILLLAGCLQIGPSNADDPPDAVRFIAVGDTGDGSADQHRVAAGMKEVCQRHGCDFVVGLGDNIYPAGVTGPYDPQFESKFEQPYRDLDMPFYMSLGNHDDGGPKGENDTAGQFQVDYAHRDDRSSQNWQMPDRHYTFAAGDVRFYALDTPSLLDHRPFDDPVHRSHRAWLHSTVAESSETWHIAFGHHPYVSNSRYGNAGDYKQTPDRGTGVKNLLESAVCHRMDMYLAGHAHSLQWLAAQPACGYTEFIVSGGGGRSAGPIVDVGNAAHFQAGETFGFFWLEVDGAEMTARAYDAEATMLFERAIEKRVQAPLFTA